MATSILSNSLQEEDTIQNNIVETKDSEPISHELMFQNSIPVNLPIDREEVEVKEEVVDNRWMFENSEKVEEPSAWEKLEYGWDKNTMVFGDILDIGYNYLTALFDPEKDMKDIAVERETNRLEEFQKEHWKMLSGKHDGVYTFMGEAASYVLDPYYIAGYYFGSPLLKSPIGSMVLNAGLLGGDEFITQLAQKGEIESWGDVGKAAAIGGGIGLVLPVGGKLVAKYLPNHLKNRAKEIASFIDDKIAKRNNLTSEELKIAREIGKTSSVKEISNKLDKLVLSSGWKTSSNNFAAPISNAKKSFYSLKTKLSKEAFDINKARQKILEPIKSRKKISKAKQKKIEKLAQAEGKKILDIKQKISDSRIAWKEKELKLIERQSKRLNKYYKLEGERLARIIEQLEQRTGRGSKFVRAVLANFTRPLFGGATGGAMNVGGGVLGMDVEDDFLTWVAIGTALGTGQRLVQNSKKIPLGSKEKYLKLFHSHALQFTFQKLREWTAGTTVTKLASFGGTTEKIGRLLLPQIDDPMASKSVLTQANSMENYFMRKASNLIKNSTPEERGLAISINRGNSDLEKTASSKVLKLADDLNGWMSELKVLYNKAGFYSPKELDNYFPRVLNWEAINADRTKAIDIFTDIFEQNYKISTAEAKKRATKYIERNEGVGNISVFNANELGKLISGISRGVPRGTKETNLIYTPISDHITKHRSLQGPYKIVEEVLERNNFLVNDLEVILPKIIQDSVKSIAFARTFGKGGQLLRPMLHEIQQKYNNLALKGGKLGASNKEKALKHEVSKVLDTVDAYFGRHGLNNADSFKNFFGIIGMMNNLNMLGRVTITSLGDIVQPFQNSLSWTAAFKGLARTNLFKASWEKGLARNLNYDIAHYVDRGLQRSAASADKDIILNTSWMGKWGVKDLKNPAFYNSMAFKGLGLEWLTGYARRFAYNAGSADVFNLSRQLYKLKNINSKTGYRLQKELYNTYGITKNQALSIGKHNNFKSAATDKNAFANLNKAGMEASNRDAIIPQVHNRLLFTQSKTPYIRILGQFLSWVQGKSAQTNKILQRIESGNARTLIKIAAVLPVYAGIQQLREYAKHGDVITDAEYNGGELAAKAWQLSGLPGWLPDAFYNRFVGPGSKQSPFYAIAPAFSMAHAFQDIFTASIEGRGDDALRTLDKRIAPFPEWRNWVRKFWFPKTGSVGVSGSAPKLSFAYGGFVPRQKYSTGNVVVKNKPTLLINELKKDAIEVRIKPKPFPEDTEASKVVIGSNETNINRIEDNVNKVYYALKKHNLSDDAIAGVMGNIATETGNTFNFTQQEIDYYDKNNNPVYKKNSGYGLFQFTDEEKNKGHRTEYNNYLANNNLNDSVESQVNYVMDNIYKGTGYNIGGTSKAGNRKILQDIFKTGRAADVAGIFHDLFEKPEPGSRFDRQSYADTIVKKFAEGGQVRQLLNGGGSTYRRRVKKGRGPSRDRQRIKTKSSNTSGGSTARERYIASTKGASTPPPKKIITTSDDGGNGDVSKIIKTLKPDIVDVTIPIPKEDRDIRKEKMKRVFEDKEMKAGAWKEFNLFGGEGKVGGELFLESAGQGLEIDTGMRADTTWQKGDTFIQGQYDSGDWSVAGKKGILEASIKGNEDDTSGYIGVNIPLSFKSGGLLDRKRS